MDVYFLQAKTQLVKRYQQVNNEIQVSPYPLVSRFTSHKFTVNTLKELLAVLLQQAALGHALLKGKLHKLLVNASRAGATYPSDSTEWILIDVDGLLGYTPLGYTPESFMQAIGLSDVSYIVQYSASSGVFKNKGLSCHILILLDQNIAPTKLKEWLIKLNVTYFPGEICLNRLNESLHWPVDITTCQNDKLIYIAPPICSPKELDSLADQPRIELIEKTKTYFSFPQDFVPASTSLDTLKNSLRELKGLPKAPKLKTDKSTKLSYSPNPQAATISGIKEGDEFTHLNLNGGDSWGYYHLTARPDIIYNFKGEPNYKTSELLPDYWDQLQKAKLHDRAKNKAPDNIVLAIRDRKTSTYYTGYYNPTSKSLAAFHQTANKEHVLDFLTNNGLPIPDSIADWDCVYNPHDFTVLDLDRQFINWFAPSKYMLQPSPSSPPSPSNSQPAIFLPDSIKKLLQCVFGEDPALLAHFLNWTACMVRLRQVTGTCWIAQGVPGTGKGLLVNKVLRPLLGQTNVAVKRMSEMHDRFNQHLENTLLCFIDEVQIGENAEHDKILADLKQFITEPTITIRKMRQAAYEVPNYTNWIFSSNSKQSVKVEPDDRRYNVGEYMRTPLREVVPDTFKFVEELERDLPQFMSYLNSLELDVQKAATVFDNEARQVVMENSMATIDEVVKAIKEGRLEKLHEYVSTPDRVDEPVRSALAKKYYDLFKELVLTRRKYLTRDELALICDSVIGIGSTPRGAAKFTRYLAHHDLRIKPLRTAGGKLARGIAVNWTCSAEWLNEVQEEFVSNQAVVVPFKKTAP